MNATNVFPRLVDPYPVMLCRCVGDRSSTRLYRVPIMHRRLEELSDVSKKLLDELPNLASFEQLRAVLADGSLGLFVPTLLDIEKANPGSEEHQTAFGAIILIKPVNWEEAAAAFAEWQFEGLEATFDGLPYSFDDIIIFANLNFSSDCWFIVRRGPMAGKVFWWTHDGDSQLESPWADDIRDWARRVWEEAPQCFGGVIRFDVCHSIDEPPGMAAELIPEKLVADGR